MVIVTTKISILATIRTSLWQLLNYNCVVPTQYAKEEKVLTNVSVYKQWDVKTSPEQYQHFLFLSYGNVYNCNVYYNSLTDTCCIRLSFNKHSNKAQWGWINHIKNVYYYTCTDKLKKLPGTRNSIPTENVHFIISVPNTKEKKPHCQ